MKITLRKAHALQKELINEVKKLDFDTEIEITEFETPEVKILDAVDAFTNHAEKRADLLDTLYVIRKAIAKANHENDVDIILADVARLDNDIGFYNRITTLSEVRVHGDILKGKLKKISEQEGDTTSRIYGRSNDTVRTHIFNQLELEDFELRLANAKKEKQKLQDRLLEINFQNEIELADEQEAVLRAANLV